MLTTLPPTTTHHTPHTTTIGQGTIGLEILKQSPPHHEPDVIFIWCGGGGMLAGTAATIKVGVV